MTPEAACDLLEAIAKISGTEDKLKRWKLTDAEKEDKKEAEAISKRRPPFEFSMVGIEPREHIEFIRDKNLVITVVDDKHVECNGQTISLSALVGQYYGNGKSFPGPDYFTYKGEPLNDLRRRMEKD